MSTIEEAVEELHKGFRLLNQKIFAAALPEPAILVQNQGNRTRNILGWCTSEEIWSDQEQQIKKFEINLTAEYLDRPVIELMETMLHEMVHLYCSVKGIKDTSRGGSYHNKRYKEQAERFGLTVQFNKKCGWNETALKPESQAIIESLNLNPEAFKIKRYTWGGLGQEEDEGEEKEPRNKLRNVWECPKCKLALKSKKEINIICGKCMQKFVRAEETKDAGEEQEDG